MIGVVDPEIEVQIRGVFVIGERFLEDASPVRLAFRENQSARLVEDDVEVLRPEGSGALEATRGSGVVLVDFHEQRADVVGETKVVDASAFDHHERGQCRLVLSRVAMTLSEALQHEDRREGVVFDRCPFRGGARQLSLLAPGSPEKCARQDRFVPVATRDPPGRLLLGVTEAGIDLNGQGAELGSERIVLREGGPMGFEFSGEGDLSCSLRGEALPDPGLENARFLATNEPPERPGAIGGFAGARRTPRFNKSSDLDVEEFHFPESARTGPEKPAANKKSEATGKARSLRSSASRSSRSKDRTSIPRDSDRANSSETAAACGPPR